MTDSLQTMVETIKVGDMVYAIIVRREHHSPGIEFFTTDDDTLQLGYMNRSKGYTIKPHIHKSVERTVHYTNEVLFIKSGRVRVNFYDCEQRYQDSRVLNGGDVILLSGGGHGFEMLEDSEIIEAKQGPYAGENDKIRFG